MTDHLLEQLAARQWDRMTRTSTTYDELNEHDQRACRALVAPILEDLRDLGLLPQPDACPRCGRAPGVDEGVFVFVEERVVCEPEPRIHPAHDCRPVTSEDS